MMNFSCCLWWFLAGALAGWLLSWLFGGGSSGGGKHHYDDSKTHVTNHKTNSSSHSFVSTEAQRSSGVDINHWLSQAKLYGYNVTGMKDLEIIEGIGPRIKELLRQNGIHTFTDLANQTTSGLQEILKRGGSDFSTADPSTWIEQAVLCKDGKWEAFKRFTDNLIGGVHPRRI
jgi:predicted flap endonuclease-1-like 5' DNA nuclease